MIYARRSDNRHNTDQPSPATEASAPEPAAPRPTSAGPGAKAGAGVWTGQVEGPQVSSTLSRGLAVLEALARVGQPLGVRELARSLGANPSIVQRLLNTLLEHGFVEQDTASRKYAVGYRAFTVGRSYLSGDSLVAVAVPILSRMSRTTELNFYLGVHRNGRVVYLVTQLSQGPFSVRAVPGEETALHTTAMGKALLAAMPRAEVERLLAIAPLDQRTPRSLTDPGLLHAELDIIRRTGIAISDEENIAGVYSAGAAILGTGGEAVAAVSCAGPVGYVDRDAARRAAREAAQEIMRRLGGGAGEPSAAGEGVRC